ncbi:unnamed protein product [Brassica napus]|uniref:(rape) hypothetical protein n=1 Tax=Brassica napus TaxID=3708 RepID=A0A816J531_BRANA|nr:unnamed protein product [Brassica napus]
MKLLASLLLFIFFFFLFGGVVVAESLNQKHPFSGRNKLFVFGDSYVDIGNTKPDGTGAWAVPYGITYPGKPSGRFSDGHISTDFLAQLLRIKLPVTYAKKDDADKTRLQYGMSFAYGGTGVFDTYANYPNMTAQINLFEQLLGNVYSPSDLSSSVALVSVAGNDYITFILANLKDPAKLLGFKTFISQVVNQTELNLRKIHTLGVKKIAIPSLTPLWYIPKIANSSLIIKVIVQDLVEFHNGLLQKSVVKLNKENNHSAFTIIDYYNTFLTIFNNTGETPGIPTFQNISIPCLGDDGKVCDDPKSAFFWDGIHPTQEGWKAVYKVLRHNITAALMPKA